MIRNRFVWQTGKPRRASGFVVDELIRLEREAAYQEALDNIENPTRAMKDRIAAARKKGPSVVKIR